MQKMDVRGLLKAQVPILVVMGVLFGLSTAFLRATVCIEGGIVLGYPLYFYARCYEVGPSGPLGPPEFLPVALILDALVWYPVAIGFVVVYRRFHRG